MSKRPTPKKRQARSSTSRRFKSFQNRSQKKLMQLVDFMRKLDRTGKLKKSKVSSDKVTKIKA